MKTEIPTNLQADPEGWHREWHATRNAQVAALVKDAVEGNLWKDKSAEHDRDASTDESLRWLFWRQYKPEAERTRSDREASPDAYLYEGVVACMNRARDDERKRIVRSMSKALHTLLGDEFGKLLYDFALENDVNIGYDW